MSNQYEVCLAALMEYEEINKMLNLENQNLRNENKKLKKEKEELEITLAKYRQYVENLDWEPITESFEEVLKIAENNKKRMMAKAQYTAEEASRALNEVLSKIHKTQQGGIKND